jgi:hypothetical protein
MGGMENLFTELSAEAGVKTAPQVAIAAFICEFNPDVHYSQALSQSV